MKATVQKKRLLALSIGAGGLFFAGYMIFSTKEKRLPVVADEQSLEIHRENLLQKSLRRSSADSTLKNTAIYAHFIPQTLSDEVCFEDVFNNQDGEMSTSPGPYRSAGGTLDPSNAPWKLLTTPDYFVWHLSPDSLDQDIYITNQNGFPIKSQVIRLQNDDEATMVLLPKAVLDNGSTYYIYLTFNENQDKQTWIQPLIIAREMAKE